MRRPLFIFNFESRWAQFLRFAFSLIFALFLIDRVSFFIFFPLYDQWLKVGSAMKATDILLVGSSHIEADIDVKLLKSLTHQSVGLFSVPGAGLVPRYYAIKERLEEKNVAPPKVIVLETSKLVFNPSRYFDDVSDYLVAYRNKGLLAAYVDRYAPRHPNWFWYQVFQSYSLNGGFDKFLSPNNLVQIVTENTLSNEDYLRFRSWARGPQTSCITEPQVDADDARVGHWDKVRKALRYDNKINERLVEILQKIVGLARENNIKLILLDPPFFHFQNDPPADNFENVRAVLKSLVAGKTSYLELTVPNNSCLFMDEGHLSSEGQQIFTRELAREI
jgi:hypothetical protein